MPDPRTPAAKAWGITYTPANVAPGQGVWRCVSVDGPVEWEDAAEKRVMGEMAARMRDEELDEE